MSKKFIKHAVALALTLSSLGLVACGEKSNNSNEQGGSAFAVTYYPGGYGDDWLEEFVKEFVAKKKYDGDVSKVVKTDYKLTAREDVGASSTMILKSKSNCPDVIVSNGITNQDISDGLVEELSSVYDTEVETSQGKIAIKDYIMPESKMTFTRSVRPGGQVGQWAVPWTALPLSIAYNETLLQKIEHTTSGEVGTCVVDGKWSTAPTTVDEMMTCFADISAQKSVDGKDISAFGFAMKDGTLWFESLIYNWWAQYQGVDESKITGQGAFYDFFNLDSAEKFKQDGIVKSLEKLQGLITKDGKFANVYGDPSALGIKDVQPAFARGEMVFCLTGDFFAKEYKTILEANKETVNAKMMSVPAYDNTHNEKYTFLNTASCMYVAKNGKNKEWAKEFLAFINDETHLVRFTEMTGGIRPFAMNTDAQKTSMKEKYLQAKEWGDFEKSTFNLYFDCDDVLLAFPRNYKNRGENAEPSLLYTYEGMRQLSNDYASIIDKLRTTTPQNIVVDGSESLYKVATAVYSDLETTYGPYMYKTIK